MKPIDAEVLLQSVREGKERNPHVNAIAFQTHNSEYNHFIKMILTQPQLNVVEIPESGIGDVSDGYHTFNELYHHRAILFAVICNSMPDKAWKSKLHDTGDMYEGMFIVGIETPEGQATYHYDIDPYWDMFKVRELDRAPEWDGHTPQDAIDRIAKLSADVVEVRHGEWEFRGDGRYGQTRCYCLVCGKHSGIGGIRANQLKPYCPNCGAKMDGGIE